MFAKAPKDLTPSAYPAAVAAILGPALADAVVAAYPCSSYKSDLGQSACWWALAAAIRDSCFACPVQSSAAVLAGGAGGRSQAGSTYAYFYTQVLAVVEIVDLFKPYRCFHGSELPSVFDLWPALIGEGEVAMAEWFVSAWTSFAATGNPNYAGAPGTWQPFGTSAHSTLVISTGAGGVQLNNTQQLLAGPCEFWAAHPVPESVIWGGGRL